MRLTLAQNTRIYFPDGLHSYPGHNHFTFLGSIENGACLLLESAGSSNKTYIRLVDPRRVDGECNYSVDAADLDQRMLDKLQCDDLSYLRAYLILSAETTRYPISVNFRFPIFINLEKHRGLQYPKPGIQGNPERFLIKEPTRVSEFLRHIASDTPRAAHVPDLLGHEALVLAIAEVIRKRHSASMAGDTSVNSSATAQAYTIGIEGPWGVGKTSILNALERELAADKPASQKCSLALLSNLYTPVNRENDCAIQVVRFNPWLINGGASQLTSEFLATLANAIDPSLRRKGKLAKALLTYQSALELADSASNVGMAVSIAGKLIQAGSQAYLSRRSDLNEMKSRVSDLLQRGKITYVVMVDDLDRLMPGDIQTVFQMIRCIADFPNVVYVVAYDRSVITSAFEGMYPNLRGDEYLEKIVQIPMQMPSASSWTIERQLGTSLHNVLAETKEDTRDKLLEIVTAETSTLRTIQRIVNVFSVNYTLRFGGNLFHVGADPFILLSLAVLQVLWPEVCEDIVKNRAEFLSPNYKRRQDATEKYKDKGSVYDLLQLMFCAQQAPFFGYFDFPTSSNYFPDWYLHAAVRRDVAKSIFEENYQVGLDRLHTLLDELAVIIDDNEDLYIVRNRRFFLLRFFRILAEIASKNKDDADNLIGCAYCLFKTICKKMDSKDLYEGLRTILKDESFPWPRPAIRLWDTLNSENGENIGPSTSPAPYLVEILGDEKANKLQQTVNALRRYGTTSGPMLPGKKPKNYNNPVARRSQRRRS